MNATCPRLTWNLTTRTTDGVSPKIVRRTVSAVQDTHGQWKVIDARTGVALMTGFGDANLAQLWAFQEGAK